MRRMAGTVLAHAMSNATTSLRWPASVARIDHSETEPTLSLTEVTAAIEDGLRREWSVRPGDGVDLGDGRQAITWSPNRVGTSSLWMVMGDHDSEVVVGFADTATLLIELADFSDAAACLDFLTAVARGVADGELVTYGRNLRHREETTVLQAGARVVVLTARSAATGLPETIHRFAPWPSAEETYEGAPTDPSRV